MLIEIRVALLPPIRPAHQPPGPFAGYLFGKLVEILDWSTASLIMVVAPPLIGVVLMSSYDYSRAQND
jgi:hypothetical protein